MCATNPKYVGSYNSDGLLNIVYQVHEVICTDTGIRLMSRYAEDKSRFYRLLIRGRSVPSAHTAKGGIKPMRNGNKRERFMFPYEAWTESGVTDIPGLWDRHSDAGRS